MDANTHIETNFYKSAYLVSQGHQIKEIVRKANGKTTYAFEHVDVVLSDLKAFEENSELQDFVKGVVKLRKIIGKNRKFIPQARTQTQNQKPEIAGKDGLCPLED